LKRVVDNLDDYIESGQIEILDYSQWYTKSGMFEADKVLQGWLQKHDQAIEKGFDGFRFAGNTSWLKKSDWKNFLDYEAMVESVIRKYRMLAICTYSLDKCKASEIIDVVCAHQIAIIKKQDRWQSIESSERKQAQQKIQEAHQYADKIIETVREPFLVLDKNLKVVSANDYFYEAFNVKPEETDGQFIYNLGNHQWDIPELRELLHEILPKKNSFKNFEVKHDFPNIGPKRMLLNASQVDEVQLILLAIEDITEHKKAEEALWEVKYYLDSLISYASAPIIVWNPEFKIIRFNHAFERLTGYAAKETIGKELNMLLPKANRDESLQKISGTLSGEYWESVEISILCKDGGIRVVLWNSANIYAEDGTTLLSTIAQGVDITELKNREEDLKESEQRFRRIFEEVADGIILADTETKKFYFGNKTIYQMLGYNEEEIKGLGIMDIHPQEALPYVLEQVEKQIRREIALAKDLPVKRKDGSVFYADVNTATITLAGKVYLMGIFRDVTERKQAEESLQQLNKVLESTVQELSRSNREIEDFAHVIAHNLKSPLRAIGTLSDWIAMDYSDKFNQEGKEQIKLLKGRVMRMSELIDSVLRCSEIRRVSNQREKVNLNTLVTETIDQIAPPESIEITIENELPILICEKAHLTEAFQNLLSNAVKYMDKPQGRVRIGCVEEDDFWKFSIADNGPGIKKQHFERIFKIFQTLLPCDELSSAGIGLAIVKKIVELYGGKIWLKSKVGEGSTFLFTLPKQETEITSAKLYANASS
jgi:two-component system sensor kinase FixL